MLGQYERLSEWFGDVGRRAHTSLTTLFHSNQKPEGERIRLNGDYMDRGFIGARLSNPTFLAGTAFNGPVILNANELGMSTINASIAYPNNNDSI